MASFVTTDRILLSVLDIFGTYNSSTVKRIPRAGESEGKENSRQILCETVNNFWITVNYTRTCLTIDVKSFISKAVNFIFSLFRR